MTVTNNIIKHLDHIEDLLIYGSEGIDVMCNFLEILYNYLNGTGTANIKLKIDGSPAIVASSDFHGETFVALKHSWEKGKRFHSEEEIDAEYTDRLDLAEKLKVLLKNLSFINIPKDEIWMGDFLFTTRKDCIIWNYPGKGDMDCVAFMPNTVVYTYPLHSDTANQILSSEIGIAWHTKYKGNDFNNLTRSNDVSLSNVNSTPTVYQMVTDLPERSTFLSDAQNIVFKRLFDELGENVQKLHDDPNYERFLKDTSLLEKMLKYKNDVIKREQKETGELFCAEEFIKAVDNSLDEHINNLKSDRGKSLNRAKKEVIDKFLAECTEMLDNYFKVQEDVIKIKNLCIDELNKSLGVSMYYAKRNMSDNKVKSYVPCTGEGYVLTDDEGNITKLVNRLDFSYANFSDDIVKGWSK